MSTFIYKRTHTGDPDKAGCFGIHDCMGSHRNLVFDSVIGVGGISSEPNSFGINGKVNWIGLGARMGETPIGWRAPLITFDHFVLYEDEGEDFRKIAPKLAQRMLLGNARYLTKFDEEEQDEISRILGRAKGAPPSHRTTPPAITFHCPKCAKD